MMVVRRGGRRQASPPPGVPVGASVRRARGIRREQDIVDPAPLGRDRAAGAAASVDLDVDALGPAQERLGREVNPTVYPPAEWTGVGGGLELARLTARSGPLPVPGDGPSEPPPLMSVRKTGPHALLQVAGEWMVAPPWSLGPYVEFTASPFRSFQFGFKIGFGR